MHTHWGQLADLDLSDHDLASAILATDKHQLVEGLVVECLFDQIVSQVPAVGDILSLDVETVPTASVDSTAAAPQRKESTSIKIAIAPNLK